MQSEETKLAILEADVKYIKDVLDKFPEQLEKQFCKYVTHDQFTPVRLIAYGFAGAVLGGFALALVALLIRAPQ